MGHGWLVVDGFWHTKFNEEHRADQYFHEADLGRVKKKKKKKLHLASFGLGGVNKTSSWKKKS